MKKVVLAYSGGLDTTFCALHLSKDLGYEVHAVLVNTGGFGEQELLAIEHRAHALGVASFRQLDVVQEYYQEVIRFLVYGNVLKNDTYPLSVSAERILQAKSIAEYAQSIGAKAIAHGSTGAGNDQVRFDMIFQILVPEVEIITPIRDLKLSRQEEIDYLKKHGVSMNFEKAAYSVNKGIWGTSVGGKETLTSLGFLPEEAWPTPVTESNPKEIKLTFVQGEIKGIDGVTYANPVDAILKLQSLAAPYGIGRDIHVGDTIIGIKGRVGFEAAAPLILIKAHHLLEKHTLSKWQQFQKEQMANFYGMQLHEGQYLDPVMRDIEAFMESSQGRVTGSVFVKLHPYRFELLGIQSPFDLMQAEFGSYGEMNKGWTADEAKGFIKLTANATKIYQHLNSKK